MTINELLLSAGGGIVSSDQVAEQQGDATVIIGLGGTGCDALLKIKKEMYQFLKPDNYVENEEIHNPEYSKIKFIAIDTDPTSQAFSRDANVNRDIIGLTEAEKQSIEISALPFLLANPDKIRKGGGCDWMDIDHIAMKGSDGAGGIRQVGRYCLLQHASQVRTAISKAMSDAMKAARSSTVNVHVIAGISGGTGSGTFIDVCYMVRELLSTMSGRIFGYFFLPDIQLKRPGIEGQSGIEDYNKANGYAAFRELDYLMSLREAGEWFEQSYDGHYIKTQDPPVDLCHLISGTNQNGVILNNAYEYALSVVNEYIMSYLTKVAVDDTKASGDQRGLTLSGHVVNSTQTLAQYKTVHGASRQYHILGASCAELPLTHIGTYLASGYYEKMMGSAKPNVIEGEVLDFSNHMSYVFGSHDSGMLGRITKGVNYFPNWNDELDLPEKLNVQKWFVAPENITVPLQICEERAKGKMEENYETHTKSLKSYNYKELMEGNNQTLQASLFNELADICIHYGPFAAEELIHSDRHKTIHQVMEDIKEQASERKSFLLNNLDLREKEIQKCAEEYNKKLSLDSKRKRLNRYLEARRLYLEYTLDIEACEKVTTLCNNFLLAITKMSSEFFEPLSEVIRNLQETFEANKTYLDNFVPNNTQTYRWRLFELSDIQSDLDNNLRAINPDLAIQEFMKHLLDNYEEWRNKDTFRIGKCVNYYMTEKFKPILTKGIDKFLEVVFPGVATDSIPTLVNQNVYNRLLDDAVPMFHLGMGVRETIKFDQSTFAHSVLSYPNDSAAFQQASTLINDPRIVARPSNAKDKIICLNFVSGVPMYAYAGVYDMYGTYKGAESNAGAHLHEKDINWREILPTPVPYSFDQDFTNHAEAKSQLYERATEEHIIGQIDGKPGFYGVRKIPDLSTEVNQFGDEVFWKNGLLDEVALKDAVKHLEELREKYATDMLPESESSHLPNDGWFDPTADYRDRVREDYFIKFGGLQKDAEKSLAQLDLIDKKIAHLRAQLTIWEEDQIRIARLFRMLVLGYIGKEPGKMLLNYRYGGTSNQIVLSDPNSQYALYPLFQSYLSLDSVDKEVTETIDNEMSKAFESLKEEYKAPAKDIIRVYSEDVIGEYRQTLSKKLDPNCEKLVFFYTQLVTMAKDFVALFGPEVSKPTEHVSTTQNDEQIRCPHCGKNHPVGMLFCPSTGAKLELETSSDEKWFCPYCGENHDADMLFCPKTGKAKPE